MSIELVMLSNHLILCHSLLLLSCFPSIRVFSNESALHIRWPKYWSFNFSINPSNEYLGLISFRIDWLDLAVQGSLKSLLQYHKSKASILQCSAFFMVQLLHLYMTIGKTIALTIWTFVSKVMSLLFIYLFILSLLFNTLSRFAYLFKESVYLLKILVFLSLISTLIIIILLPLLAFLVSLGVRLNYLFEVFLVLEVGLYCYELPSCNCFCYIL